MSALLDYMQLCRLCLVKDKVNVPIFGDTNDVRQIFLKITACLPVKVSQDDNLPQKICDSCLYKVDLLYQFWNTSVNAEKQLIQWLSELGVDIDVKNSDAQPLQIMPQSHAHPHSIHTEAIMLKEEHQDSADPSMFGGFNIAYQPDASVASTTEFDTQPAAPVEQVVAAAPKRRGRPPKQKTPPKKRPPLITPAAASTRSPPPKRRSSAAAAAAAVAAAAAAASDTSDESDGDDHMVADDSDDEDDEVQRRITKEEADSDDEEYIDNPSALEPTTFVGVPSTSGCDTDQPGPSGLNPGVGGKGSAAGATAAAGTESGSEETQTMNVDYLPLSHEADNFMEVLGTSGRWRKLYYCSSCPKTFRRKNKFIQHSATHISRNLHCTICQRSYKNRKYLAIHIRSHGEENFTCDVCSKSFCTKAGFKKHFKIYPPESNIPCVKCHKIFHTSNEVTRHIMAEHERQYYCYLCQEKFEDAIYLKYHLDIHIDEIPISDHQCEMCGKTFETNISKEYHIKMYHLKRSKTVCDLCGKELSKESLKLHMLVHRAEKPCVCNLCGRSFKRRNTLKVHMLTHTREKPHQCPMCDKRYTQSGSLKIHIRQHTGETPYKCTLCPEEFISRKFLNAHLNIKHKTEETSN